MPSHLVDRLQDEPENGAVRLEVVSTYECLAGYVRDKGPLVPQPSDILAYAQLDEIDPCGEASGGLYDQGKFDRRVFYDFIVKDGIAGLTGGHECAGRYHYYRR